MNLASSLPLLGQINNPANQAGDNPLLMIAAIVVIVLVAIVAVIIFITYGGLWFQAYMSNANVSLLSLIGMSFRRVNARVIVQGKIMAMQAGIGTRAARPASPRGGSRPTTWPAATCRT